MKNKLALIISVFFVITACSEDSLYNFFLGPQPNFTDKKMLEPGLNIFGMLRPDSINSTAASFIHVEKIATAINESDTFSFEVNDASVTTYRLTNGSITDSVAFSYMANDSISSMYKPTYLKLQAGDHYKIVCKAMDLPELTGETTVPNVPVLENDTLFNTGHRIRFSLLEDTSAAMYDVYLFTGSETITKRIVRTEFDNTAVEMDFNSNITSGAKLTIYAYDRNLAQYFTASNVFIKPNTYRPPFSSVKNGYGCFGSMNILIRKI